MVNSFKSMRLSGVIKRTDTGMFIKLQDIHIRDDIFNRVDDERTQQANEELFAFMQSGGTVPPLEVVPRDDGGVWICEGHRRTATYHRLAKAGKPVEWIHIMPFKGNDVEQLARRYTSNNQLKRSDYEDAMGLKDFEPYNLSRAEIAKLIHVSLARVDTLYAVLYANHDVQQLVKGGDVAPTVAAERIKEYGSAAGEVLKNDVEKAKAAGIKKVTKRVISPQFDIKKARQLVELLANANFDFRTEGGRPVISSLNEEDHEKIRLLVEEYRQFKQRGDE
ncbi:chromosome partitioning protein ParB [Martelella alba]|uniref:Chromosome partitioning protein ParB n=1 Tax=Martelella alba TaxID=2590451 RepID=A0ABY2SLP7_9HYPH|nr:chromosome partitioning protein ParB [Martelella alba]TKI06392.1 chromosome partitioning protein ParB [Martelella alba]